MYKGEGEGEKEKARDWLKWQFDSNGSVKFLPFNQWSFAFEADLFLRQTDFLSLLNFWHFLDLEQLYFVPNVFTKNNTIGSVWFYSRTVQK